MSLRKAEMEVGDSKAMKSSSELERLGKFVERMVPRVMEASVHCRIHPVNGAELEHLTVSTLPRRQSHIETVMLPSIVPSLKLTFTNNYTALRVFQKLVEYPSLIELNLCFSLVCSTPRLCDGGRLFSLVSASQSICKLRITFISAAMFDGLCVSIYVKRFFHIDLPILLRESPLRSLILEAREVVDQSLRWMTYRLSFSTSWALSVSRSDEKKSHHQFFPLKEIFALFPSVKEFGPYLCSSAEEFHALMRVFVPQYQANTSLFTLKVRLPVVVPLRVSFEVLLRDNPLLHLVTTLKRFELEYGLDVDHVIGWKYTLMGSTLPKMNSRDALLPVVLGCTLVLGAVLRINDTLQHVELSQESHWPASGFICSASHARVERDFQSAIGARLEQMRENELRQNTRLQSLHLGWWRMVRVGGAGDQWEIKYAGPCVHWSIQQEKYVVKVRMRR